MADAPQYSPPSAREDPLAFPQLCGYLAERSPQPMAVVEGLTHLVLYVNPAFRQLVGKAAQQLIGRRFEEAVPEGLANHCAAMLGRVFATGSSEALVEQEHGPDVWTGGVLAGKAPMHRSYLAWAVLGADQKPVGVMIQVTDTTEIARFRTEAAAINEALLVSGVRQHELMDDAQRLGAELKESEGWLRLILDAVPQKIFTTDPSGAVRYFNPAWMEYTGLAFEQIQDWGWQQFIHPDDVSETVRHWKETISTGEPFEHEHRFRRHDGVYRWHLSRARCVRDLTGGAEGRCAITRWVGSNTDIDDLRRAQDALWASEARLTGQKEAFEAAVNGASIASSLHMLVRTAMEQEGGESDGFRAAFFTLDASGTCLHPIVGAGSMPEAYGRAVAGFQIAPNSPLCGVAVYTGRALIVSDITLDPLWEPFLQLAEEHSIRACWTFPIQTLAGKVVGTFTMCFKEPRDANPRDLELAAAVAHAAALIISRDTESRERQLAQDALRDSVVLEREARQEAQDANRSKDVFLATLAHELRTPLNAVLGWAVMLRSRTEGVSDSGAIDAILDHGLTVIERNVRAQGKLIEDVLDVARVSSGKFELDRGHCELTALMAAALETVRPAAEAKGVALNLQTKNTVGIGPLTLLADAARLNQAILNLLNNAIKFTPSGGAVTTRLERHGDRGRIIVSDTGKGIGSEFLPFVFDRYKQAEEGSTRGCGGLGLGLTIVRHITELHGGTVTAASEGHGHGATFTMDLPLHPPADTYVFARGDGAAPPDLQHRVRLDDLRILVVDDELDSRTVTRLALELAGATVVTASSAAEAYKLASPELSGASIPFLPLDVLVSDLGMPDEDGYSLVRRLRADGINARDLPAVALTAFTSAEDRQRVMLAGFQSHLSKPVDPHELIVAVGALAGRTGV